MVEPRCDLFVIYTQGDDIESRLVEETKNAMLTVGLPTLGYEEMEWERDEQTTVWRSFGGRVDPLRYATGDPRPFKHSTTRSVVNREQLKEYFEKAESVVFIAPRAIQPSTGVREELETLQSAWHPPVLGVSWHMENKALLGDANAFYDYRSSATTSAALARDAKNIRGLIWVAHLIVALFTRLGTAGRRLGKAAASRNEILARAVARSARFDSGVRQEVWTHWLELGDRALDTPPDVATIVADAGDDSVSELWRFWRAGEQTLFRYVLGKTSHHEARYALRALEEAFETFCEHLERKRPELARMDAEGLLRLGRAEARLGDFAQAEEHLTSALSMTPSPPLRQEILAWRAMFRNEAGESTRALEDYSTLIDDANASNTDLAGALLGRGRVRKERGELHEAIADLDRVLALRDLRHHVWFSALLQRALAKRGLDDLDGAVADLSELLEDHTIPRQYRALALGERGRIWQARQRWDAAIDDFSAVITQRETLPEHRRAALFLRADTWLALGNRTREVADLEELARLNLGSEDWAEVQQRLGKLGKA
jgi:tetratricopeptide (TPR) repeat protein